MSNCVRIGCVRLRRLPQRVSTGALEGVDAIFGFHNMPHIPLGAVGGNPATLMAGTSSFNITFQGRGGHAAMPHGNIDPIVPAAHFVTAVQVRFPPCQTALHSYADDLSLLMFFPLLCSGLWA